jgi:hypothetical protein
MDKRKKILVIVLLVSISMAILFWPKPLPAMPANLIPEDGSDDLNDTNIGSQTGNIVTPVNPPSEPPPPPQFPLKRGSKGTFVLNLQQIINFNDSAYNLTGGKYLQVDGVFGPATEARVLKLFGAKTVTEQQYLQALGKYRLSIPYQALNNDEFPLRLGSYGNRVAELNFVLGTYTDKKHPYSKNFTAKTVAALKAKTGYVSTNAALYTQLTSKPATSK